MLHYFELKSRKSGNTVGLTAIGKDPQDAEARLRAYSFKDLDWSNWTLRHVTEEEIETITEVVQ